MIRRLLKGCQHEHRVLHLGHSKSGDSQDLALEAHDITQQHDMSGVDSKTVRTHGVVNLLDDACSSRLDSQHLLHLHDVVGRSLESNDT